MENMYDDDRGVKGIIFPRFITSSDKRLRKRKRSRKIRNDGGGLGRRVGR